MANYCFNTITVEGKKKQMLKFLDKLDLVEDEISREGKLTNFYPMPEILNDVQEGYNGQTKSHYWWKDTLEPLNLNDIIELSAQFGHFSWYNWAIENWGTKHGDYDISRTALTENKAKNNWVVVIGCESKWSPPAPLLQRISREYDLDIKVDWNEEGGQFGQFIFDKGNCIFEKTSFNSWYNDNDIEGDLNE